MFDKQTLLIFVKILWNYERKIVTKTYWEENSET